MDNKNYETIDLSRKRTLLASERTLAAWIRTALTAVGFGIALLNLLAFTKHAHETIMSLCAVTLLIWGLLVLGIAAVEYQTTYKELGVKSTKASYARLGIIIVPILLVLLVLGWAMIN